MLGIDLKHHLATVAVAGGLLAAAGPAGAATAPAYQHNQTDHASLAVSPQAPGSGGFWLGWIAVVAVTGPLSPDKANRFLAYLMGRRRIQ